MPEDALPEGTFTMAESLLLIRENGFAGFWKLVISFRYANESYLLTNWYIYINRWDLYKYFECSKIGVRSISWNDWWNRFRILISPFGENSR